MPPSHSSNSAERRTGTKDALGAGEGEPAAPSAWAGHGARPWGGGISFGERHTTPFLKRILVIPSFFPQRYNLQLGEVK